MVPPRRLPRHSRPQLRSIFLQSEGREPDVRPSIIDLDCTDLQRGDAPENRQEKS